MENMKNQIFKNLRLLLLTITFVIAKVCSGIFAITNTTNGSTLSFFNAFPGTIAVASTTITGTSTSFNTASTFTAGDLVYASTTISAITTYRLVGTVSSIGSATAITLSSSVGWAVPSGAKYFIYNPTTANTVACGTTNSNTTLCTVSLPSMTIQDASGTATTITIPVSITLGGSTSRLGAFTHSNSSIILEARALSLNATSSCSITLNASTKMLFGASTTGGYSNSTPFNITGTGTIGFSGGYQIVAGTYADISVDGGTSSTTGALVISGSLTTSAGTLALANNRLTLSSGSTLTNAGTISTTMPTATSASWVTDSRNGSGTGTTPSVYGGTISYAASSGAQTIVSGTYQNLTLSNTTGINTTAAAITVTGILNTTAGGKIQINSGGSLTLSGTLTQSQVHVIDGDIELNGGDFIVSGKKDKDKVVSDLIVNPTLPTPPYMIIRGSINDVLTSSFRQNSIKFVPSNATGKESHIRFAGSGKTLGNISSSANMSIQINEMAYFEIGDGTNSVTLTLQDTLRLCNGLRMRSNATLTTSGMLQLLSSANKIQGQQKIVGFIDTSVASSISGNVCFVQTMSATRKLRFLGNPFTGNLNITDFTDDIDISGNRTGANNNNFTATANSAPSAFTYDNATDAWVAITNTSPTQLTSMQGMKILIRGVKGYGLDANNGSPTSARIILNGAPILGDQTIALSSGYNFICNPFLSPVDLDKISKTTNVADVLYMYNPGSSGFQTFNKNSKAVSVGGADIWSAGTSFFF
jgi:hypothetical protein